MSDSDLCRCGHIHEAHEHYRRGSDCAICGVQACAQFSAAEHTGPAPVVVASGAHNRR